MWRMHLLLHASIDALGIVRECHMQHVLYPNGTQANPKPLNPKDMCCV